MANEEHLAILRQGVEVWNYWRKNNPGIRPDFNRANLTFGSFPEANFIGADFTKAELISVDFPKCDLRGSSFSGADCTRCDFSRTDLKGASLTATYLDQAFFTKADLSGANLSESQAVNADFEKALLTGACIQDWNINSATNLTNITCDYIYLRQGQQERRPISGNFAPGEFTKLFQKSLETVDLIFRNGIDWDAFAYSFKKLEVENQGAQLDVQSIEKKGDGILVVRVAISSDADKAKIHSEFIQGYEFAAKALETQYQARLEDKDKVINQLFSSINQLNKQLAETSGKVSIYYQPNSQFAGGVVDANTVNADQIGDNIQNNNA
ncbi:pentapeptide repeat-containing protein [Nostoc sp. C110]|uniref:pentapeptide repeat-containing protein n=1 Tax=Nostoc sp. C110 TaxID=3349876 RepID=UPI00370D479C